jgi:hypothetical protein
MNKKVDTNLVFTPSTPATLTFIERDEELNNDLVDALRTPGKQIVVYGHSGFGKTTLLINKIKQTYEHHIVSRCMIDSSINQLILDAFDQLNTFYTNEVTASRTSSISGEISAKYLNIKSILKAENYESTSAVSRKAVPIQLTAQRLAEFFGAAKCCWIIEDFHKVQQSEKVKLSQMMKVFMDSAMQYPDVKLIALGAVETAREVVAYDNEMKNRVAEIHVPLMTQPELNKIMDRGQELLNIKFNPSVTIKVSRFSSGLPAVCHQLCLNMCFNKAINYTADNKISLNEDDLEKAIQKYLKSNSDTLKAKFDKATKVERSRKYENTKEILRAMLSIGGDEITYNEILAEIHKKHVSYPAGNLTSYLKQLTSIERGEVIRHDHNSNKFSFSDPFFKAYAYLHFNQTNGDGNNLDLQYSIERLMEYFLNPKKGQ